MTQELDKKSEVSSQHSEEVAESDLERFRAQFTHVEQILNHPIASVSFFSYLMERFCPETYLFLMDVKEFESSRSVDLPERFYTIIFKYIQKDADFEININSDTKQKLIELQNEQQLPTEGQEKGHCEIQIQRNCFADAKKELIQTLQFNQLNAYLHSKPFQELVVTLTHERSIDKKYKISKYQTTPFSSSEKELLLMSWKLLTKPTPFNPTPFTLLVSKFYEHLFTFQPDYKDTFFSKSDMRKQTRKFVQIGTLAIAALENPEKTLPVLKRLAIKHQAIGVRIEHFLPTREAFVFGIGESMDENFFNPQILDLWRSAFDVLINTMLSFYDDDSIEQKKVHDTQEDAANAGVTGKSKSKTKKKECTIS